MLYSFVFHCDFSNPNRITSKEKARCRYTAGFFGQARRRESHSRKGVLAEKAKLVHAGASFLRRHP